MYAVIETGGKQYRVQSGDVIDVELLQGVSEDQPDVVFDRVLMLGGDEPRIGQPLVDGAQVRGVRLADVRGPKVKVFKMKRRKGYRRHQRPPAGLSPGADRRHSSLRSRSHGT